MTILQEAKKCTQRYNVNYMKKSVMHTFFAMYNITAGKSLGENQQKIYAM